MAQHIAMRFELLGCPIKPASQLTTPSLFNNSVSISNLVTSPTSSQTDTSSFLNISKESYPTDLASTTHIVSSSSSSSSSSTSSSSSSSILPTVSAEAFSNSISSTATSLLMQRSTLLTTIMSGTPEHTSFWITSPENTSTTTNSTTTQPTSTSTIVSSSTQTTCRDKKGIDCASMDNYFFICKDRVSATTTCPRFCGLCRTNISSHSTETSPSAGQTMIYSPAKNDSATIPPTAPYEPSWSTEMSTDSDVWTPQTSDKYYSTAIESSSQSTVTLIGSATTSLEESTVSAYPASTENMSSTTTASYKVVCDKNSSLLSAYSCDFESGLCGFNVASNPNIWVISNGPQAGIQSDHTTNSSVGRYVLFDAGDMQAPNSSVASLTITQAVPPDYVLCLSFWFSMPTSDANLSIFKHFSSTASPDELLWQQSNKTTHGWEEASIILTANQTFQVVFSSTKTIETGYLGIDDVAVHFVGHV